jgi:DNA-binding CsgD family transcriptional regulator
MAALHRGLAQTAYGWLRESVAGMRTIAPWRISFALVQLVEACALVGDADGAAAASAEADDVIAHAAIFEGMARRARGWAAIARGQRVMAVDLLLDAGEWCDRHGQHTAELFALHDVVRLGAGRRVVSRLQAVAAASEGRWAPVFGEHAAAASDEDGAALERVADRFEGLGALLLAAEAATGASAAFRRAGVRAGAQRTGVRAKALAARCEGARSPALEELDEPVQLTARENEIVHLAATGLSSGAIAERLFVSTRTVEGHLHRAYAKLGVNDRRGLARLLASTTRLD